MSEKRRFLEENGFYITTPAGESMLPFIVGGQDLVTVVPLINRPESTMRCCIAVKTVST